MFFDIVAIEVSCPFFLCEIAITTLDTSHYELHGVHHIHYNKDYNYGERSNKRLSGVHHIHYNKDYNYLLSVSFEL